MLEGDLISVCAVRDRKEAYESVGLALISLLSVLAPIYLN